MVEAQEQFITEDDVESLRSVLLKNVDYQELRKCTSFWDRSTTSRWIYPLLPPKSRISKTKRRDRPAQGVALAEEMKLCYVLIALRTSSDALRLTKLGDSQYSEANFLDLTDIGAASCGFPGYPQLFLDVPSLPASVQRSENTISRSAQR